MGNIEIPKSVYILKQAMNYHNNKFAGFLMTKVLKVNKIKKHYYDKEKNKITYFEKDKEAIEIGLDQLHSELKQKVYNFKKLGYKPIGQYMQITHYMGHNLVQ